MGSCAACAVLIKEGADEIEEEVTKEKRRHQIRDSDGAEVRPGTSKAEIIRRFGQPAGRDTIDVKKGEKECINYYVAEENIFHSWNFCFDRKNTLVRKYRT